MPVAGLAAPGVVVRAPHARAAAWSLPSRGRTWHLHLFSLALYAALTVAMFGAATRNLASSYVGSIPDATQSMWFLSWTAHGLGQPHSLLFSDALNAPSGVNLMWNTPMLLLGIVAAPITLAWGPVVAYNLLIMAAFSLSAWAAYYVFQRYCGSRTAAWTGGLLFAFGPYMLAQSLGHLDLVVMAYPPIALLLCDAVVRGGRRWWLYGGLLGVATAAQFLVMEETIVGVALACTAVVVAVAFARPAFLRAHWRNACRGLATALLVFVACTAVPLWYQLTGPQVPAGLTEVANTTSSDLAGFVVPTAKQALSPQSAQDMAGHFVAQATGQDAYVGIPMLLLAMLVVWSFRRRLEMRIAAALAVMFAVLSLGPWLNVDGRVLPVPMPGWLLQHVPLLGNVVPLRLMAFTDLALAAIVAWGLAHRSGLGRVRRAAIPLLTVLTVASWFPALPRPTLTPPDPPRLPAALSAAIPSGGTVLFAPLPSQGNADAMWYQLQETFRFRLVSGYAYGISRDVPLEAALDSASPSDSQAATDTVSDAAAAAQVISAYRALGISTIVVPPGPQATAYDRLFTRLCGTAPRSYDGFSAWSLAPAARDGLTKGRTPRS